MSEEKEHQHCSADTAKRLRDSLCHPDCGCKLEEGDRCVQLEAADELDLLRGSADRIGKWLSAALDDPAVCAEMKADIRAWFNSMPTGCGCALTAARAVMNGGPQAVPEAETAIAALAKRFWSIHPKEIQDLGITREQFYEREMRALFAALALTRPKEK